MKPVMKVTGFRETTMKLRSLGKRVPDTARSQMRRSADEIVEQAKINSPVDDEFLEKSIRIVRDYGTRNRLEIDIIAGGQTVINQDGRTINLDQYVWIIHEAYEMYQPGKRTLKKMGRFPDHIIGSGFLTRAADTERPKLERNTISVIESLIQEVME